MFAHKLWVDLQSSIFGDTSCGASCGFFDMRDEGRDKAIAAQYPAQGCAHKFESYSHGFDPPNAGRPEGVAASAGRLDVRSFGSMDFENDVSLACTEAITALMAGLCLAVLVEARNAVCARIDF